MSNTVEVVAAVIVRDGRVLLTQRPAGKEHEPLCWELPGGKVEGNESHHQALAREIGEELGVKPRVTHQTSEGPHYAIAEGALWCDYVLADVFELVYRVELDPSAEPKPMEGQGIGWFTIAEMTHLDLVSGLRLAFADVASHVWSTLRQVSVPATEAPSDLAVDRARRRLQVYKNRVAAGAVALARDLLPRFRVEEDGDQGFAPMPESCTKWPCKAEPEKAKLEERGGGFMVCPLCRASYGRKRT